MNFDAHIKELRAAADKQMRFAEASRADAADLQDKATTYMRSAAQKAREAKAAEELARGWDLLADALASGGLTGDQLRGILAGVIADDDRCDDSAGGAL